MIPEDQLARLGAVLPSLLSRFNTPIPPSLLRVNRTYYTELVGNLYYSISMNKHNARKLLLGLQGTCDAQFPSAASVDKPSERKRRALSKVKQLHLADWHALEAIQATDRFLGNENDDDPLVPDSTLSTTSTSQSLFPNVEHLHIDLDVPFYDVRANLAMGRMAILQDNGSVDTFDPPPPTPIPDKGEAAAGKLDLTRTLQRHFTPKCVALNVRQANLRGRLHVEPAYVANHITSMISALDGSKLKRITCYIEPEDNPACDPYLPSIGDTSRPLVLSDGASEQSDNDNDNDSQEPSTSFEEEVGFRMVFLAEAKSDTEVKAIIRGIFRHYIENLIPDHYAARRGTYRVRNAERVKRGLEEETKGIDFDRT